MNDLKTPAPETQDEKGFWLIADFDRLITRIKKDKEGRDYNTYEIGTIVRTDEATNLYAVKTKHPEKWKHIKTGTPVKIRVLPRAYKDFVYYTELD